MREYISNIKCVLSHFRYARKYGFWGVLTQLRGLFFVVLNWRNPNITNWKSPYSAMPVWRSDIYAAYEMDGTPYQRWEEIVIDQRWWVPGFNEESVS